MQKHLEKILVVDDEPHIRKNLKLLFKLEGYEVDLAENGEDALNKFEEAHPPYDLVFLDLQMPKMNGFELLEILRQKYSKTVVVMVSAFGTISRAVESIKLGAVDFIEKPFDPEKIKLLAEEILFRKKIQPASTDDLLHLALLAKKRNATSEARAYLKMALQRDLTRPEPYYELALLEEVENRPRTAMQLYSMSLEAKPMYEPAQAALKRLGYLEDK